jgi:hypothetical protein
MSEIPAGAMRFNSDSQKLEYWNGSAWFQVHTATPNLATAGDREPGARMVIAGGNNYQVPVGSNIHGEIQYINVASTGNSVDFAANITETRRRLAGMASATRGVFSGGATPSASNQQDFITFASTGTCTFFGGASVGGTTDGMGFSNSTRGIVKSGYVAPTGATGTMDYITIASIGSKQDFGDLSKHGDAGGVAGNSTRALMGGGLVQPSTTSTLETSYVTIHTLGDNVVFGELSLARFSVTACASRTRTVWGGGGTPSKQSVIDYGVISSLGNAVNFGDLSVAAGTCSTAGSATRGIWAGGYRSPSGTSSSIIDYIQLSTEGNAVDFGDLSHKTTAGGAAVSNAHGGL